MAELKESDIFTRTSMTRKINLDPRMLHKNYDKLIISILQQKIEGICNREGFVEPNSIEITDIGPIQNKLGTPRGRSWLNINFSANVANPIKDEVINCKVTDINQSGVLTKTGPYIIMIPVEIDELDVKINQIIPVQIIRSKFSPGDKVIYIIGKKSKGEMEGGGDLEEINAFIPNVENNSSHEDLDEDEELDEDEDIDEGEDIEILKLDESKELKNDLEPKDDIDLDSQQDEEENQEIAEYRANENSDDDEDEDGFKQNSSGSGIISEII